MPNISKGLLSKRPAIVLHEVQKTFQIKHTQSFKEAFITSLKRQPLSTDFNALDGISFEVPEGQSIALLGRNGSGKSTTLKLVSGVMQPDSGWVRTRGRVAGLLEVGAGFHPNLTGRQNVYLNAAILGMTKTETDERFDDIVEFSEIGEFIDTEVKRYSSGMYSRLGFSVAVHTEVDVLLVDEILSVGDAQFRQKCNKRMLEMQGRGKTMFVVSHNPNVVKNLCERGIVLDKGQIVFDGPIDEAVEHIQPRKRSAPEHAIVGVIKETYDKRPSRFGKALGPQKEILANGGGLVQEFEKGLITASTAEGRDVKALPLTKGVFLAGYLRDGGPSGKWGFIAGQPSGDLNKYETRTLQFQHGTATYSIDDGLRFEPLDEEDA